MILRPIALAAFLFSLTVSAANLLDNPTFERHKQGSPSAWRWEAGKAKAALTMDTGTARSGKTSILIVNPSARSPHVYSSLSQTIPVSPSTRYTLSCYVKANNAGVAWMLGGKKWEHRIALPRNTKGKWQRVSGSFTTTGSETTFTLRILSESQTAGFRVDDVQVERGGTATPFIYYPPLEPGDIRLELSPFDPGQNLVPNPSFEQVDGIRPKGWMWDKRNIEGNMTIEAGAGRNGNVAVKFTNSTAFGAHVYGWFGFTAGVPVNPNTAYTLTAFVRSEDPGRAWIGGGKGWKVRCSIPRTDGEWRRISKTFITQSEETSFALMLITESPTKGIWLDDVSLRKGIRPLPVTLEDMTPKDYIDLAPRERPEVLYKGTPVKTRWAAQRWPEDAWTFSSGQLKAEGLLTLADPKPGTTVTTELLGADGKALLVKSAPVPTDAKALFLTFLGNIEHVPGGAVTLCATLRRDGKILTQHTQRMQLVTPGGIRAKLREAVTGRDPLADLVRQLESKGLGARSRVTLTVLDNFIPWVEADIVNDRADRAWDAAQVLTDMTERETARAAAILAGKATDFPVPRYQTGPLSIDGPSTVGARRFPNGRRDTSPVFLTGYGHFGQVRRDVEKLPGYGCNFLQIEFGPRSVLPDETSYSDRDIDAFLAVCDRAAKANVSVNLLVSPHYFPGWALKKWPELKACHGGFFKYCVHDPRARSVIEKSLRYVIPRIKDHPALHSICLSNEPIAVDLTGCAVTAKAWPAWLAERHGDIATLNQRWGTEHTAFTDVPIPPPKFESSPMAVDFVRFNQETFADFHRWMADIVHDIAPDLPVHAKIMMSAHFYRGLHGVWSVSPELFSEFSQYNGNDCCNFPRSSGDWSTGWRGMEAGYDFQRSLADKPIFNSENHVIVDRDHGVISPDHLYTELWQGAIHGQSSTTYWVWERTNSFTTATSGSILHRPDGVEAIGRCNLDLNRLAAEITSIQRVPPEVGILWSSSSTVQGYHDHYQRMRRTYEAAAFQGVQLGFVTERRLEAFAGGETKRPLDSLKVLLVPHVTHLSAGARQGLTKLAGRIRVVILGDAPAFDEYGHAISGAIPGAMAMALPGKAKDLSEALGKALPNWGIKPLVPLTSESGQPLFGVEVRAAGHSGTRVASICNLLREPCTVNVGGPSLDLISGRKLPAQFTLEPLQPVLLRFAR
ncbi:MAG: hypothetical protein HN742_27110 [Lentisphaerae bacterium]|jgi:hypothetical protein|nr:hypothetical protein [Lentisphaerota bacterium]MBT5607850.1 hypothetical protein [Lentisphaerota bacterium]MBT7054832.1 hypothetical protein [Lentisphaerota bacterium]MBT7845572.1 hypothetical protein [Lentisphaerota bacterium]